MARCRARTKNGTGPLCRKKVSEPGLRCFHHKGLPEAPPRLQIPHGQARQLPRGDSSRQPAARRLSAEERRQERIRKTSEYCADIVGTGWKDAVAESAVRYVSQPAAERILGRHRRRQCRTLAQAAAAMLVANQDVHRGIGWLTASVFGLMGAGAAVRAFVGELAANIPLPTDAKIVAVARGIQVTGIAVCVAGSADLTRCQCFVDLALDLAKTEVKKLLITAEGDWVKLSRFPPRPTRRLSA